MAFTTCRRRPRSSPRPHQTYPSARWAPPTQLTIGSKTPPTCSQTPPRTFHKLSTFLWDAQDRPLHSPGRWHEASICFQVAFKNFQNTLQTTQRPYTLTSFRGRRRSPWVVWRWFARSGCLRYKIVGKTKAKTKANSHTPTGRRIIKIRYGCHH